MSNFMESKKHFFSDKEWLDIVSQQDSFITFCYRLGDKMIQEVKNIQFHSIQFDEEVDEYFLFEMSNIILNCHMLNGEFKFYLGKEVEPDYYVGIDEDRDSATPTHIVMYIEHDDCYEDWRHTDSSGIKIKEQCDVSMVEQDVKLIYDLVKKYI